MSSRNEHDVYGMVTGATTALVHALSTHRRLALTDVLCVALGGAAGGVIGSRLPDLLEPATSSWHRSTAHSVAATGAVAYVGARYAAPLASQLHEASEATEEGVARAASRFVAAAAIGAPAGYMSHTLADALTPRGIPLLTRGL